MLSLSNVYALYLRKSSSPQRNWVRSTTIDFTFRCEIMCTASQAHPSTSARSRPTIALANMFSRSQLPDGDAGAAQLQCTSSVYQGKHQ